jgi:protein-S-isoprenylcysteine O-methyltransferase Ste14
MPAYAYAILVTGVVVWFTPFALAHRKVTAASTVDRRSRWGVLLQFVAYSLLWQGHFWTRPLPLWRICVSILLFVVAAILSWTSSTALGSHLRVDAALGAEHSLVRSGPYGIVRNPIYTSMLCVLCATAVVIAPWQLFLLSLLLFVVGTEIRVRTEERLLASRFGEEFQAYKRNVAAYIPFL